MSKRLKQKRKQSKNILYNGWPIENLRCFSDYNQAIFLMENPKESLYIGICVAVNRCKWPDSEIDNVEAIFDGELYDNIDNEMVKLGHKAEAIPTIEQLKDADWWVDRKEYLRYEKEYGRSPFGNYIEDENDEENN